MIGGLDGRVSVGAVVAGIGDAGLEMSSYPAGITDPGYNVLQSSNLEISRRRARPDCCLP